MPREISESEFNSEVIESSKPVLVDFYADWCQPCKMLSPVIDNIENRHSEKLKVVKVNVDKNPDIVQDFDISSIPTIVLFKENKMVKKLVGFKQEQALEKEIGNVLS